MSRRRRNQLEHVVRLLEAQVPFLEPGLHDRGDEPVARLRYARDKWLWANNSSRHWTVLDVRVNPYTNEPITPFPSGALTKLQLEWDAEPGLVLQALLSQVVVGIARQREEGPSHARQADLLLAKVVDARARLVAGAESSEAPPPPGWYDDPLGDGQERWWTGTTWGPAR